MIKHSIVVSILLALVAKSEAGGLPVYDAINHATNVGNEIVNFAKWAETEVHAAATELNTLNTYEQELLQVERMGDPRTLTANIPGVQNLQTLGQIYSQAEQDISDWSAYVNPESWKITSDQILNLYGQPGFNEFTASNGIRVGMAKSLIQFQVSNYNTEDGARATVDRLNQQLKTQTQQLAAATSAMQAATDLSQVHKYHSIITGLDAAINSTKAALAGAELSEKLQTQQNNVAQEITRSTQAQQTEASDLQAIDQGLHGLPVAQMNQPILWGQKP